MSRSLAEISVTHLKGVGAALAKKLERLSIYSLQDLLLHFPLNYQNRVRIQAMAGLQPHISVLVEGQVRSADIKFGRKRSLVCRIQDGTGSLTLRFFHFSVSQKNNLKPGTRIRCFGEVRPGHSGLEMIHPEYQLLQNSNQTKLAQTLTPVYPLTEGLQQNRLRNLMAQALEFMQQQGFEELLPERLRQKFNFPELNQAIQYLHNPPLDADTELLLAGQHVYQHRLAFEEFLAHQLSMLKLRQQAQTNLAPVLVGSEQQKQQFMQQLPFQLTAAQIRVSTEIHQDLTQAKPMWRLLQGDVGSGKTLVAALAMLQAVGSGNQAVLMAPTEILAEQHLHNFKHWFEPLNIEIAWLVSKLTAKQKQAELERIVSGQAQIIIGTHALFQDGVEFKNIGLVVVDEHHRFGVHQRLDLLEKGRTGQQVPHQLIMTATPIPRTLTMSAYADLDCSMIDELPPNRRPVETVLIANTRREQVIERVRHAASEGRQIYWVCTLVEESESLACQAATLSVNELAEALPELNLGLVHGQLKAAEKAQVMAAFKAGEIDLLVATTVIEVGVDVPNASVMIIENPERLGLAQLHQLRGRVGRGSIASYCLLLYQEPLSKHGSERLQILRHSNDGFYIAEQDLAIRGPGEILGTKQTGMMTFKIADLERDSYWLEQAQNSLELLQKEPNLIEPLIKRWLAQGENYAHV